MKIFHHKILGNFKAAAALILLSLMLLNNSQVLAAQSPRFLGSEKKFRAYIYNPNDVYRYVGHYNYQGFIEFEADENIVTISMGDSSLWLFEHLGNRLFLKPVADNANTNMTVITNKKIYHFELLAKEASGIEDPDLIFVVKFVYPDEKDKNILEFPRMPISDEPDMRNINIYNFNYEFTGEPSLAPIKVFDNGEFTYFQFTTKSAEIPAIFSVDSEGFESLVNFRSAGDYIIVERIAPQFTLRNGNEIVCVYNNNMLKTGKYLAPGQKREKTSSGNKSAPLGFDNASPFKIEDINSSPNPANTAPRSAQSYPTTKRLQNLNNDGSYFPAGPQGYAPPVPSFYNAPSPYSSAPSYQSQPQQPQMRPESQAGPFSWQQNQSGFAGSGGAYQNPSSAPYLKQMPQSGAPQFKQGGFVDTDSFAPSGSQNNDFQSGSRPNMLQ